jgi:hypothetical protein
MKIIEVANADGEVTVIRGPGRDGCNMPKVHGDARQYAERQLFTQLDASAPLHDPGAWLARKKAAYGSVLDMLEQRDLRELDLGCISDHWRDGLSLAWGRRDE